MSLSSKLLCLLLAVMANMDAMNRCMAAIDTMTTASTTTKEGCPRQCGNITIPYPFGIGINSGCSLNPIFEVFCDFSFTPPVPFILGRSERHKFEILEISETQLRMRNKVAIMCFNSSGQVVTSPESDTYFSMTLDEHSPFSLSPTANKLIVIGCQESASLDLNMAVLTRSSCSTTCSSKEEVVEGQCKKFGCCQADVPKRSRDFTVSISVDSNNTNVISYNPCGYAFLAEQGRYTFGGLSDLNDPNFPSRVMETVPVAIDWVIGNGTCAKAQKNPSTYTCSGNTTCSDNIDIKIRGYNCICNPGFQGNPYIFPGCSDIDECADPNLNRCSMACLNTVGSFICYCPHGYTGDGRNHGTGCIKKTSETFVLNLSLGISLGSLFLGVCLSWLYIMDRNRKLVKMKKNFFQQNGGWLLQEQLSTANSSSSTEPTKIFTETELKAATNNFDKDCILGKGAYGTVYKGILLDNRVVAIKKSKLVDQTQIEQFIHEVVILCQINHRNVVKLLGSCLETEVPLLVYEFISKGTLYSLIHDQSENEGGRSWELAWSDCLRIASDIANALAYLHSAASPPIIHRDIKSMNILLDDNYTAKIADFGASRLIPMNQSEIPTLVQGTIGYLDPEYLYSSLLTDKSDVYSFGVVLAELLTRKKPLSQDKFGENRNLTTYFLKSVKQDTLFDILDPRWVAEASSLELVSLASLTQRCLAMSGKDRPTMREVSVELEAIKKLNKQTQ